MKLKVFGVARDIMGGKEVEVKTVQNVAELKKLLLTDFPKLKELNSLLIAVNQTYASDEISIAETDEIAIIPPVSGG
ncbi:MAG: MoaD/ThiS family protein [Bacteroidetes bacterium]|nr:MoaD/ThiS family protein [Bacteroidota bacterium]